MKNTLRQFAKNIRSNANMIVISEQIMTKIKELPEYPSAKNIMIYYPHGSEIDLLPLVDDTKKWLLPVVNGKEMDVYFYEPNDDLVNNQWKIPEPCSLDKKADKNILDMVILPGLCADKKGFRLGYGLGFYDRFIRDLPKKCVKVLPVLEELFIEEIPKDPWDEPVNIVVTEKNIYNH